MSRLFAIAAILGVGIMGLVALVALITQNAVPDLSLLVFIVAVCCGVGGAIELIEEIRRRDRRD